MVLREVRLAILELVGHVAISRCITEIIGCQIFFKLGLFGQVRLIKMPPPSSDFKSLDGQSLPLKMKFNMKIRSSFILGVMITFISSCGQAQNRTDEKQAEEMLLQFYSKHFYLWENTPVNDAVPFNVLSNRLDSLMQIYCTSKLRNEAREALNNVGADWLTNNLVGYLNESLKIEKNVTKENCYLVSFIASYKDAPGGPDKKQVTFQVTVVKDGESYKIAEVK